jgi:hypothetical protein
LSQEAADNLLQDLTSNIDATISGEGFTAGDGFRGGPGKALLNIAGPSEEFAAFLGISQAQLEAELSAEGATPGSVAEAHGQAREELRAFLIGQTEVNLSGAVAAGTLSQEDADNLLDSLTSNIDAIIEGEGFTPGGAGPRR